MPFIFARFFREKSTLDTIQLGGAESVLTLSPEWWFHPKVRACVLPVEGTGGRRYSSSGEQGESLQGLNIYS